MPRHVPVRLIPNQFVPASASCPVPVHEAAAKQGEAGESYLSAEGTQPARALWGRLVLKVARVQRKDHQ